MQVKIKIKITLYVNILQIKEFKRDQFSGT